MSPTVKKSSNPLPMKERIKVPRQLMPEQPAEERAHNFTEVNLGFFACAKALIFGYSFFSHCFTNASFRSSARCNGFWQVIPNCANRRRTEALLNLTSYCL